MGRMLEALKQAEVKRQPSAADTVPLRPFQPEAELPSPPEPEEEIPYIEVGGPARAVEFSAKVAACKSGLEAKSIPAVVKSPMLQPIPHLAASALPPQPMGVVFQPVPTVTQAARLAPAGERFAADLIAFHQPDHPISQQYRSLVASLANQQSAPRIRVLLFTALSPRVGTTTVLLNVAITAAKENKSRVAVVDANLRHPALAKQLGLPAAPGIREILNGTASLRSTLQETGLPNLLAMTAGEEGQDEANHSSAEIIRAVLHQLRDRFELVLVDAPCWKTQPELIALGPACDAVYLVLDQAHAESTEVRSLYQLIPQQGGRLAGCILVQR